MTWKVFNRVLLVLVLGAFVSITAGCPATNEGEDGNEGESEGEADTTSLVAVNTGIVMHQQGMIKAGDDVIAYGYGGFAGVDYIIPSVFEAGDPGLGIPDGDTFQAGNFEVAGKKIALVSNFLVTIFDTVTQSTTQIPETDVRLATSPSGQLAAGTLQADGNLIVVRNDDGETGNHAAVIDVSGAEPVVTALASPTGENEINGLDHAVVDAAAQIVVGLTTLNGVDTFLVWDLESPDAEPQVFPIDRGVGDALFKVDGNFVLFHDSAANGMVEACVLSIADGTVVSGSEATGQLALNGGSFLYFLARDANDRNGGDQRSAIGSIGEPDDLVTINEAGDADGANFIDGSTTNNGVFGWGQMGAITENGGLFFISGVDTVGSGEYLQVSTGGAFSVVQGPTCLEDDYGCGGTNVDIYGDTLAFKNGDNSGLTHVSFVILP